MRRADRFTSTSHPPVIAGSRLCSIELKDFKTAEDNLQKATDLHAELAQPLDAVRVDHARGILLIRQGNAKEALTVLSPVRHQYRKHSFAEEAGLAGLLMVEAMLMMGDNEQAEHLARTIASEFLAAAETSDGSFDRLHDLHERRLITRLTGPAWQTRHIRSDEQ